MSTVTEIALLTKLELCKMASIELVTTMYSYFTVDLNHINIVVIHTYHKHFNYFLRRSQT